MARQMTPDQMVAQFKRWVPDFHLYSGYATRGYGPGSISDVEGVMIHHTGSDIGQSDDYLDFLFNRGRPPQVPPPLCNFATDMDGDFWLGAAERANHAGMGSSATLDKVVRGTYPWAISEIAPGPDNINGNSRYYGNEVRFDGGQPMTRPQWISAVLSSAACCDFHGWGAWHVIGHKEHTTRKPDPGHTLMYEFRRDVAAALKAGPGNWPTPQTEDDMPWTEAQLRAMMYGENARYGANLWAAPSGTGTALIETVDSIAVAVAALGRQITAEDAADDTEFRAAMAKINASLDALKASVPPPVEPPKV